MADFIFSNSMLMLERSMGFQWTKQRVILDNIANAETPNYKAKYVTFEEALRASLQTAAGTPRPMAAMGAALEGSSPVVRTAQEESTRMDGNGVNVAQEQMELVRNAYQMQYVMNAINSDFSLLRTAIRGQ